MTKKKVLWRPLILLDVNRLYVNYSLIYWFDEDSPDHCEPDSSILSSVHVKSSCSACLTTGQFFSAKTRASTSHQWIDVQLHLVYARVCVLVSMRMRLGFIWVGSLSHPRLIFSVIAKKLTWQPSTPTQMQQSRACRAKCRRRKSDDGASYIFVVLTKTRMYSTTFTADIWGFGGFTMTDWSNIQSQTGFIPTHLS